MTTEQTNNTERVWIFGQVQSGKTDEIMTQMRAQENEPFLKVLVIQNLKSILQQYNKRLADGGFNVQTINPKTARIHADTNVVIVMNNIYRHHAFARLHEDCKRSFVLFVDEYDQTIRSCKILKNLTHEVCPRVYYITATPKPIDGNQVPFDSVIQVPTADNYYGLDKLRVEWVGTVPEAPPKPAGVAQVVAQQEHEEAPTMVDENDVVIASATSVNPDEIVADAVAEAKGDEVNMGETAVGQIYRPEEVHLPNKFRLTMDEIDAIVDDQFLNKPAGGIMLINHFSQTGDMKTLSAHLSDRLPANVPVILYLTRKSVYVNGNQVRLPVSSIARVIDEFPADRYPHLIIIAYRLAARGLSYVSSDFSRHITHQIVTVSKDKSVFIQSIRAMGKYTDGVVPTLFVHKGDQKRYERMVGKYLKMDPLDRVKKTKRNVATEMAVVA